jgi:hypothetical protein
VSEPIRHERIWLQKGAGLDGETTWCQDRIDDDDVEYIRADLVSALVRETPGDRELREAWDLIADFFGGYSDGDKAADLTVAIETLKAVRNLLQGKLSVHESPALGETPGDRENHPDEPYKNPDPYTFGLPIEEHRRHLVGETPGDTERLDWILRRFFERHWSGTIGDPETWRIVSSHRHTTRTMRGFDPRTAIDAAMNTEKS